MPREVHLNKVYHIIDQQLHVNQHGFRQQLSTTTQLMEFYDRVLNHMDNGLQCDTIVLDLSKAFDSVPHHLLLHKIQGYGINDQLLL